jgi:MFS transporter, ACS family, tartrate transporter
MRLRILFPFMLLIIFSSLDRVNISIAAIGSMNTDLGLTPETYGFAASIFFFGYLLFQFPSAALHKWLGTRAWLVSIIVFWGVCAASMAFVESAKGLYVLRFLLGVGEAGLTPGIVLYCNRWMPKQFRASAIAITLLAIPTSVICGAPLSGWLMSLDNPAGLAGWRWMFLIEGVVTITLAALAYIVFAETPDQAKWLSGDEKNWLTTELAQETRVEDSATKAPNSALLLNGKLWAAAAVWFALLLGSNGIIFWLPQVIKQLSGLGSLHVSFMSAVPWLGIAIGMVLNARHSDKSQERYGHVTIATVIGALALLGAVSFGATRAALACLFVAGLGLGAAQGVFWTIPGHLISARQAAYGITLINLIGNLASLTGPPMIGFLKTVTGTFNAPVYGIAAVMIAGAALLHWSRQK